MYRKEVDDANVLTLATTHLHRMKKFIRNRWGFVYPSPLLYNRFLEGIRMGDLEIVERSFVVIFVELRNWFTVSNCGCKKREIEIVK